MKQRISLLVLAISIALLGLFLFQQVAHAHPAESAPYETTWINAGDSSLYQIEARIERAMASSFMQQSDKPMSDLMMELDLLQTRSKQPLVQYWMSYLQYYRSIYYLRMQDAEKSEADIDEAIDRLKGLKSPNSEDYALLAMLESFSIQFAPGLKAAFVSSRVKKHAEQAIAIDPENPRAYYVLGSNDYYTPEKYGGGEKAEEYFKKSLSFPAQAVENPYLPSWGRREAHETLIRLYMKKEQWDKAKAQFQVAQAEFPDDYQLSQLAGKLVGR